MSNFIINAELRIEAECLCDENEQLKDENEHMWLKAFAIIGELLEENVKLRELMRDTFGGYKGAIEMLPSSYSKYIMERGMMDISDRMHELGVEVN